MTKTILYIFLISFLGAGLSSCKIYSISVDSFKNQFSKNSYRIDSISCTDKKGTTVSFENSSSFEIHITDLNDEKFIFTAQSVNINNDTVIGRKSTQDDESTFQSTPLLKALETLYTTNRKYIPINSIKKIVLVKW